MIAKIFKITVNIILGLLITLGIFVVFSFVPFPRLFGGQAGNYRVFTVQSGSMEPTIHTGSLIFVKPAKDYQIGDIITKKTSDPKVTITHRIIEKKDDDGKITFRTRGDANDGDDMEDTAANQVIGKTIFKLPFLGYPVAYAKTVQGLILLIVIPSVIIIYDEMNKIKMEIRKKIDYRNRVKKRENNEEETEK